MTDKTNWTSEQLKIFNENGNTLVSASAGSGKTTVMVEKIIRHIKSGTSIGELLVLSYTNASAADMREKITASLFDYVKSGGDRTAELREELDNLNFADIGTMDSFCGRIIRENFELLGVSPAIAQMDNAEASEAKKRIMNEVLEAAYEAADPDYLKLIESVSSIVDDTPLADILLGIYDAVNINPDPDSFLQNMADSARTNAYGSIYEQIVLNYYKSIADDYLAAVSRIAKYVDFSSVPVLDDTVATTIDILNSVSSLDTLKDIGGFFESLPVYPRMNIKGKDFDEEICETVKKHRDNVKKLVSEMQEKLDYDVGGCDFSEAAWLTDTILNLVKRFSESYTAYKRAEDKLDFADLSQLAIKLLSDKERADKIAARYSFIFVDEYQDINPLQESILQKLARGNVFMVGDSKQSIYAFRNADTAIFLHKKKLFENNPEKGKALPLTENFRSTRNILEFSDRVFGAVMTEKLGGLNYAEESAFINEDMKNPPKEGAEVDVKLYELEASDAAGVAQGVYSVKKHLETMSEEDAAAYYEGVKIAEKIKEIVGNFVIPIKNENGESKLKKVAYLDIAILFSKRTGGAPHVLRALRDNNIPYVSDNFENDGGKVFRKELVNLLRAMDNAQNEIVFTGYLLSYFGGLDEQDLADIKLKYPKLTMYQGAKTCAAEEGVLAVKCRAALAFLHKWRGYSAYTRVDELLNAIISETSYDAYVLSKPSGITEEQAVTEFVRGIGALDSGKSVQSYLKYLESGVENELKLPAAEFGNAVRLTTIHTSKGLEYPVVFLCCIDNGFDGKKVKLDVVFDKDLGVGVKLFNRAERTKVPSIPYLAIELNSRRRVAEEKVRLLYVALTRAKNYLFISGACSAKKLDSELYAPKPVITAKSFLDILVYAAAKDDEVRRIVENVEVLPRRLADKTAATQVVFNRGEKIYDDIIGRVIDAEYAYAASTVISPKYTVSALNKTDEEFYYTPQLISADNRGKGIAYHTVMEHIDLSYTVKSQVDMLIASLVDSGTLTAAEGAVVDSEKILNCINQPLIKRGIGGKYLRERSFMLRAKANEVLDTVSDDYVLLQGTVDLVLLGDENVIIDFKSSSLSDDDLIKKYEKQLNLYKIAVEASFGVKIDKKLLYSFESGHFIEIN